MNKIFTVLCLIIIFRLAPVALAETTESDSDNSKNLAVNSPTSFNKQQPPVNTKNNYHLEIGGSYTSVDNKTDEWKSLDLRLTYSGLSKITPFGSISRQTRNVGSQFAYGLGSYINVNTKFYMIAGVSGAPIRDPNVVLSPRFRMDLGGFFKTSLVDGLVVSTGITHFPKYKGNGGDIIAVGGIYYGKIIFSGALNYNISQPGSVTSLSGQLGFAYGTQGKYWIGGGISGGKVAYTLASEIPLDVRYKSGGANLAYTLWLGKDWGIINRLDYGEIVLGKSKLIGITTSLFFEF
jgi:YaiO family outer membrane protein